MQACTNVQHVKVCNEVKDTVQSVLKILEHGHFLKRPNARLVIFRLKIRKKDASVRPLKVIYAIYDSSGIITVQNCAKITSKSITLHFSLAHQRCPVSMQPSSAQEKSWRLHELNTRTWVELCPYSEKVVGGRFGQGGRLSQVPYRSKSYTDSSILHRLNTPDDIFKLNRSNQWNARVDIYHFYQISFIFMVRQFIGPTVHWSDSPLVWHRGRMNGSSHKL